MWEDEKEGEGEWERRLGGSVNHFRSGPFPKGEGPVRQGEWEGKRRRGEGGRRKRRGERGGSKRRKESEENGVGLGV